MSFFLLESRDSPQKPLLILFDDCKKIFKRDGPLVDETGDR